MKQYRWTSKKPLARANPTRLADGLLLPGPNSQANFVREGDVFVPTPQELAAFSDRIEIEEVAEGGEEN